MSDIWQEVDEFLELHAGDFSMSFGLEYSSVVDWVADFTPCKHHPNAREYGLWQASGATREQAIRKALNMAKEALENQT